MDLVIVNNQPYLESLTVAKWFKRRHEGVLTHIRQYSKELQKIGGELKIEIKRTKGRPIKNYLLNYGQAMFLASVISSSPTGIEFKKLLCKSFQANTDWLQKIKRALENFDLDDIECRYVYAAQDQDGNLKIGISNNPERRLAELNIGNAQKLKLVYIKEAELPRYQDETQLHQAAAPYQINGEWFTEEAMEVLNA